MKILDVVNRCSVDELTKFNLSKARAQKVLMFKKTHGSFNDLQQILELDGFGVKVLQKFCSSVVKSSENEQKIDEKLTDEPPKDRKVHQYYNPRLDNATRDKIRSCLGVNVHTRGVSWAKISFDNEFRTTLDAWSDKTFIEERRITLSELISITKGICESMPVADCYVFETPIAAQPSMPGKNVAQININVQKSQLVGMMALGLLYKPQENLNCPSHQVIFVRNFLPSRLFRTKIGNERVSTEKTVENLFASELDFDSEGKIQVQDEVRAVFEQANPKIRDLMGHALLTALTFQRVCIQKCDKSLDLLEKRTENN
ncbi:uncharacterized protein LOC134828856 [Culicoides brevitarsis]|uniref:uncharacterized protein LOC134828856 n=1 Tax=Culicoides brevitarsis TaxID=469753 RepID=UPI00307BFE73